MSGYRVAVDYGTSFTAAALVEGSAPEVVEFASERHSRHLSSLVLVDQRGELHVGVRATAKRATVPADHVCVAPKRQLDAGSVQLGMRSLTGAEVVGATLAKVAEEVLHQHNGQPPEELVMTHPAAWSTSRCEVLTHAAVVGGLATDPTTVRLVSEPAAAASFYAGARSGPEVPVGGSVAVYDLGGGTFDCAVLTRTTDGWVLAGPPGGDQRLGGEDFDEALLDWVAERILDKDPDAWEGFQSDETPRGRRDWVMLLEEIRTAKHNLSHEDATEIVLPPGALPLDSLLITRAELTVLISQALDLSMHAFDQCLNAAEIAPSDLTAVYLTGGSSRIPAVKAELHRRFGLEPTTYKDPKTITALGALTHLHRPGQGSRQAPPPPGPGDKQVTIASARVFREALALTAAMSDGSADPGSREVVLVVEEGKAPILLGGHELCGSQVLLAGSGDGCTASFPPGPVLEWLGNDPDDDPLALLVSSGAITFTARESLHLATTSHESEDRLTRTISGKSTWVEFDLGDAASLLEELQSSNEPLVPLVLTPEVASVFDYVGQLRGELVEPVAMAVPRPLLVAVMTTIRRLDRGGEVNVKAVPGLCNIEYQYDEGLAVIARFADASSATPSGTAAGGASARSSTVTITAKPTLGGVGASGTEFQVEVGGQIYGNGGTGFASWQTPVVVALVPGRHTISAWYSNFQGVHGKASLDVHLAAGQQLRLRYEQPVLTFQRGRLRFL